MKLKLKKNNEKYMSENLLIFIILINIVPVIIFNLFTKESRAVPMIVIGAIFAIQTIILIIYTIKKELKFNKKYMLILIIYTILMISTQIINYLTNEYNIVDIANIMCKFITVAFLIILPTTLKITEKQLKRVYIFLVILGIIASIYNIILYSNEIIKIFTLNSSYSINIKGFFANRNQFGQFLTVALIANIFLMEKSKKTIYKISGIVIVINILLTMSRTVIFSAVTFIFLYYFLKKDKKQKLKYVTIIGSCILVTFIVLIIFMPQILENINKLFLRVETIQNASGRTNIWKIGIEEVAKRNPILGIGRFEGIDVLTEQNIRFTQYHNIFIEALVSGGIVELLLLIYMIYKIMNKIIINKTSKDGRSFFISAIVAFLVISIFESCNRFSNGYVDTLFTIFFFTIPILIGNAYKTKKYYVKLKNKKNSRCNIIVYINQISHKYKLTDKTNEKI